MHSAGTKGGDAVRRSRVPWLSRIFALPKNDDRAARKAFPGLRPRAVRCRPVPGLGR